MGFPGGFTEDNITRIHEHLLLHDRKADFIGFGLIGRASSGPFKGQGHYGA